MYIMQEYELCQVPTYLVNYDKTKKVYKTINVVGELLNHDFQMHERLHKDDLLKLSVDIDRITEHNPSATFQNILKDICEYVGVEHDDVSYTQNIEKVSGSYHVVIPKYYMLSSHQKIFWKQFREKFGYGKEIDTDIFDKDGWFRLPNQTGVVMEKDCTGKFVVKENKTAHTLQQGCLEDFVLKYIQSSSPYPFISTIPMTESVKESKPKTKKIIIQDENADDTDKESEESEIVSCDDEFINLLECIGDSKCKTGDYNGWVAVGQALKNELKNAAEKYFVDWTFKYGSVNKKKECHDKIRSEIKYTAKTDKKRLTKATLHMWAKQNNCELYNKLLKKGIKKCDDKSFENVATEFEKIHSKIINRSVFVKSLKSDIVIMSKQQLKTSYENMVCEKLDKNGDIKIINFIDTWTRDNPLQRCYDDMGMYPKTNLCPSNIFNLWQKFDMEIVTKYAEKKMELGKILNHIKILCGNDDIVTDYIIKWIAQMIQYPETKSICPTFISREGAGKGTLLKLLSKMLGSKKVFESSNPSDEIWGKFNGLMANAFLVNLNELSKKDTLEAEGRIKALMTDARITINNKGVNSFEMDSYHRFIITTNNEEPINTSKDDRRKLIIRSSDEKCGDKPYFADMHNILDDVNVIKTCYEYFKTVPDMDKFNLLKIPETEYQNDLKELKTSPIECWIKDFVEKNADENDVECSSQKCYDLFSNWTTINNNDYKCTKMQFCVRLKRLNLDGVSIKKTKINNLTVFDIKKLKKIFGIGCLLV